MSHITLCSLGISHLCLAIVGDYKQTFHHVIKWVFYQSTDASWTQMIRPLYLVSMFEAKFCSYTTILNDFYLMAVFNANAWTYHKVLNVLNLLLQTNNQRMFQSLLSTHALSYHQNQLTAGHTQRSHHHLFVIVVLRLFSPWMYVHLLNEFCFFRWIKECTFLSSAGIAIHTHPNRPISN